MDDIFGSIIGSRLVRLATGLVLLGVSTFFWFAGRFWPWGWVVGGILVLWAIPGGGKESRY